MFDMEDLFDRRSVVGSKLEELLREQSYTKIKFCDDSGISRPTLDKLLSGTLTNKVNYEKHLKKALDCLNVTPDMLMGNVRYHHNKTKMIRDMLHIKAEAISAATGITAARLQEIESGGTATLAELRDIAVCLHTSVKNILGTNFFEPQTTYMEGFVQIHSEGICEGISGYWGHIGLLGCSSDEFLWYPISGAMRSLVYRMLDKKRIVIPCMNNKLLYINMENIKKIVLLDDDCDQPSFGNWDSNVDCGSAPPVIYEAIPDYIDYFEEEDGIPNDIMSSKFALMMDDVFKEKGWDFDTAFLVTDTISIYYNDGTMIQTDIDFDDYETISSEIERVYDFGADVYEENVLLYRDLNGSEIIINIQNTAIIELPLDKTEEAICKNIKENIFYD